LRTAPGSMKSLDNASAGVLAMFAGGQRFCCNPL
jgi:hypothetical protein